MHNFQSSQKLNQDSPQKTQAVQTDFEVRTMPQKFLSMRPSFKGGQHSGQPRGKLGLKKNLIIGFVIILFLGGLMVLAAWLFLKTVNEDKPKLPAVNMLINVDTSPIAPEKSTTTPAELPVEDGYINLDIGQWLDFSNSDLGYAFKYPSEWQKIENNNPDQPVNALQTVVFKDQSGSVTLWITIFNNPSDETLIEWIENSQNIDEANLESFNLHAKPSYKYEDEFNKTYTIYSSANQKIYSLIFVKTDNDNLNKVYSQLLSNFEFIDTEPYAGPDQPVFKPAVDTDHDNLTDLEEELFGSDKNRRDTDGDGYIDGDEVANLYDPTVAGSAHIYESTLVSAYINEKYNYNITYPSSWQAKGEDDSFIFQDAQGEFVQILVTANEQGFTDIKKWYQETISSDTSRLSNISVSGLPALRTVDSMKVYLLFGDSIYNLIYNIGLRDDANFITTFDMMIKSFKLM